MAKRSSGNAVAKLDKQISELTSKADIDEKESIPMVSKNDIEDLIKKTTITKNTSKKKSIGKNKNSRDKIIVVDDRRKKNTKKVSSKTKTTKNNSFSNKEIPTTLKKASLNYGESTSKIRKLEKEMLSLYDRVNDIVDDLDYEKTVVSTDDIVLNDIVIKEKIQETKLDKVSISFLDRILKTVFIIFMVLFTAFIGFVIFVSTF